MALTGLQIQKLLPRTNCRECGSNTCMAFAMKLAARKAEISACPYASEEAIQTLGAATEPPVRGVALGADRSLKLGEETVLYRHEKTFVRQTLLAVSVDCGDSDESIGLTLGRIAGYALERVGESLTVEMVAVVQGSADVERFAAVARTAAERTGRPLVLRGAGVAGLVAVAEAVAGTGSVLAAATSETVEPLRAAAAAHGHALAITAPDLDGVASLGAKLREEGFRDVILQYETHSLAEQFQTNSVGRRAALRDSVKALGYPSLRFVPAGDLLATTVEAVTQIDKYGSICVLPSFDPAQLSALMTLRQNIYTDPQKPIQVEPRVYPVGEPGPDS
jgi:acetyl-CoA decarbonylase/synthase complex subunit gamma